MTPNATRSLASTQRPQNRRTAAMKATSGSLRAGYKSLLSAAMRCGGCRPPTPICWLRRGKAELHAREVELAALAQFALLRDPRAQLLRADLAPAGDVALEHGDERAAV